MMRNPAPSLARLLAVARLVVALPVLLGGCGGGSQTAEGGIVGTGIVSLKVAGTIASFGGGTLTVNDRTFAATAATVNVNGQPAALADLRVGMVVAVTATAATDGTATATSIDYRADLRGVVDGVDRTSKSFTLLGQSVRTDAVTVVDGGSLDTLIAQYVEVSGLRATPGEVVATLVQVRPAAPASTPVEVSGSVTALDPVARTFRIGAQLVDYGGIAAAQLPAGLANGVIGDAIGTLAADDGRLRATSLAVLPAGIGASEAREAQVEGIVTAYASAASFEVSGQPVDARNASVVNGTLATLANDLRVTVAGRLASGVLVASRVEIEQVPALQIDGLVESVDAGAQALTAGGAAIVTTVATQFEDRSAAALRDFTLASLQVGDHVVVTAARLPALTASRIVRLDLAAPPPTAPDTTIRGAVSSFASVADFRVAGQGINASSARFEGGTAGDLANGRIVEVVGRLSGQTLLAVTVTFEDTAPNPPPPASITIEGAITRFASIANFDVAGQTVNASGARVSGGSAADLAVGVRVEATGIVVAGVLAAQTLQIEAPSPSPTIEAEGTITAYVSIADFTIAGQRVNATNATIRNGTAADIAVGRRAHATGPLVNGVLVATLVELEDAQSAEAEGAISAFVSVASFVVAGRQVDASAARFRNGTAAGLANGVRVKAEGTLAGAVLRASTIEFK